MVWGASLATGPIWLALGLTGTTHRLANLVARPVVVGIILGLGFGFKIGGAKMMAQNWWIGGAALFGTVLLLDNRVIPAMFVLLLFGAAYGMVSDASLIQALGDVHFEQRTPHFAPADMTWHDFLLGAAFLALPQVPLTLGNAVIAITEENNRLFPDRLVNESRISTSTGLMNLVGASVGGVPMCHGAVSLSEVVAGLASWIVATVGIVVVASLDVVTFAATFAEMLRLSVRRETGKE
jgi:hypothetical protein